MIKGVNRRVVVMKDTGSDVFDEAYFIIKRDACRGSRKPIEEAKRIIRSAEYGQRAPKPLTVFLTSLLIFVSGAVLGYLLAGTL